MKETEVFIDAEYLLQSLRSIKGKPQNCNITKNDFKWENFVKCISDKCNVNNVYYYSARLDETENKKTFDEQKEFLESVENSLASYNFVLRMGKMIKTKLKNKSTWNDVRNNKDKSDITWVQKGVDTKIVLDMCTVLNRNPNINSVILVSGDSDFCEILNYLNSKNIVTKLVTFARKDSRLQMELVNSALLHQELNYQKLVDYEIVN
ncbi:NYN domain-containing protein [Pumilibacter muris]|uniref:NYN domain-containing protein n=1 Tax=Pumilibacter muris TaxID=2941510 RepID=UPI00203C16DF|nr:NYN domain-containing protein [Pumilibacter muris]